MTSLSVLFLIDGVPSSSSAITSMVWKEQACFLSAANSSKQPETASRNSLDEIIFILSRDGKINVVEGDTGKMISSRPLHVKESIAISMYVIGKYKFDQQHYIFSFIAPEISLKILRDFCTPDNSISASEASNDKQQEEPLKNTDSLDEPLIESNSTGVNSSEVELSSSGSTYSGDLLLDPLVLLCCENSLRLFSAKSLIQVLLSIVTSSLH